MINVIDQDKCIGCGTCFKSCSLDVFRLDTDQSKVSPCMAACLRGPTFAATMPSYSKASLKKPPKTPSGKPIPRHHGPHLLPSLRKGMRAQCRGRCGKHQRRRAVPRRSRPARRTAAVRHTGKVAVVGSGPAGLSCACFMARMGYPVTVFEAAPRPGGMLRYGIPAYRLPDAVVEAPCGPA